MIEKMISLALKIMLLVFAVMIFSPVFLLIFTSVYKDGVFGFFGHIRFLLLSDHFYLGLKNSFLYAFVISTGQLVPMILMSFVFSKFKFKFKKTLYVLYAVILLIPFQVLMLQNYYVLSLLKMTNRKIAVYATQIFLPFGVIYFTQYLNTLPDNIIEAAQLDGASTAKIVFKIILPMAKKMISVIFFLSFADGWNIMEPVIMFITDSGDFPLSVMMREAIEQKSNYLSIAGIFCVLPLIIFFALTNIVSGGRRNDD
ncbi:MAG: ABC transporter permease subunit [Oscillospiraceae bacterium]|nr:ABC transporter permease subunit [Oscillospiraceae bacterium]